MRVTLVPLLSAALFLISTSSASSATPWKVRAGLGYDYLSQEFFQDSLVLSGPDSSFESFLLKNEYLNDLKGILSVRYQPDQEPLSFYLTYEQTNSQFRLLGTPELRLSVGESKIQINSELEYRGRTDPESDENEYFRGSVRFSGRTPISGRLELVTGLNSDGVTFARSVDYGVDYFRFGGRAGLAWELSDLTRLESRLLVGTRQVPDSQRLEYLSFGWDASLFMFGYKSSLDLYWLAEHKNYQGEPGEDDLTMLELSGRFRYNFSDQVFGAVEMDGDLDLFGKDDPVNSDIGRGRGALLAGWTDLKWTISVGPEFEFLEEENEATAGEDYAEFGGRFDLDLLVGRSVFLTLTGSTGRRDLIFEDDLRSDFAYGRASLIADLRLAGHLNLNLLTSIDKEWADHPDDDNTTYIVSSSLLYEF